MKIRVLFECEYCGKQSINKDEIERCEADHMGLTIEEKYLWNNLKATVEHLSDVMYTGNYERTKAAYDKAIEQLVSFEQAHNIE